MLFRFSSMYIYYFWISCLYTRCTYSQCMPRTCISTTFDPTCVVWISTCGRAFGTVSPCMCNEVWKVWGGQSVCTTLKEFQTAQNTRIWSFFKKTTCYICFTRRCCSLLYSLFFMWTSQRCGCIYALSSLLFSCQAPSSSSLPSQFLLFLSSQRWDC